MKIAVAASDMPDPQGSAPGRDLWAWCEGMRTLGHEVEAWIWRPPDPPSAAPVPEWARYAPVEFGSRLLAHLRGLVLPRNDAALGFWEPDPAAVVVADHVYSIGAVLGRPRSVVTLHFRALLDARAVGRISPATLQTARAERRGARRAQAVLAYSERVGRHLPRRAAVVPIAHPLPGATVVPVEKPVVSILANWQWPPNRAALDRLLSLWPVVRDRVPEARLVIAGRHFPWDALGSMPGVEPVGEVQNSAELLSETAVVAFPCPPSSGPKVKVLEALMHGVPVLTTPAGMEGILAGPRVGALVAEDAAFADRLVALLRDPAERVAVGQAVRQSVLEHHSPVGSATARIRAFSEAFGLP